MMSGTIIIFNIRRKTSPGKAKYLISSLDRFASLMAIPSIIPKITPTTVAISNALLLVHFLQHVFEHFGREKRILLANYAHTEISRQINTELIDRQTLKNI